MMTSPRHRGMLLAVLLTVGCSEPAPVPMPPPPPVDPGYTLRMIGGVKHTAAVTEILPLVIEVERALGGYDGPVTFSAETPPGIVVIFRPPTVLISNETDVLVVAEAGVEPRLHQITIRGRAPDRPDRNIVLELTVTP